MQRFEQSREFVQGLISQKVDESAPYDHEEYMHHEEKKLEICAQKKKLEIESIIKDKKLIIHYDYINNFNLSISSILKVIL